MLSGIIFPLCLLLFAGFAYAQPPEPSAYWRFDQIQQGQISEKSGRFPGVLRQNAEYELISLGTGKALDFSKFEPEKNSAAGMRIANAALDTNAPFSVTASFKLNQETAQGQGYRAHKSLLANCGTRGPGLRIAIFYGMLRCNSGDGEKSEGINTVASKVALPPERLLQLAVTYDGAILSIYLEGAPVASGEMSISPNSRDWYVGSLDGKHYGFLGAMQELGVYTKALSQTEVAELYLRKQP